MPRRLTASTVALPLALALSVPTAWAQTPSAAPPPLKKHKPNPYGSPLDTLMSTRLWTDVPKARDFVRETRPAAKDLDYTPLTGKDPERPKPRDKANIEALQAELEHDGALNDGKARGLRSPAKAPRAKATDAN